MFDKEKVAPIAALIGLKRDPSNEEMQAAATVALEMVVSVVNSLLHISESLGVLASTVEHSFNEPAVRTNKKGE